MKRDFHVWTQQCLQVTELLTQKISINATWRRSNKERPRRTAHNKTNDNELADDRQNIYHDMNDVKKLQTKTKKAEEQKSSPLISKISSNCTLNKMEGKRH